MAVKIFLRECITNVAFVLRFAERAFTLLWRPEFWYIFCYAEARILESLLNPSQNFWIAATQHKVLLPRIIVIPKQTTVEKLAMTESLKLLRIWTYGYKFRHEHVYILNLNYRTCHNYLSVANVIPVRETMRNLTKTSLKVQIPKYFSYAVICRDRCSVSWAWDSEECRLNALWNCVFRMPDFYRQTVFDPLQIFTTLLEHLSRWLIHLGRYSLLKRVRFC